MGIATGTAIAIGTTALSTGMSFAQAGKQKGYEKSRT